MASNKRRRAVGKVGLSVKDVGEVSTLVAWTEVRLAVQSGTALQAASEYADARDEDGEVIRGDDVTIPEIVAALNVIAQMDKSAMAAICCHYVQCNEALSDHPSVQVRPLPDAKYEVGFLGILNGLCGTHPGSTEGYICAVFEADGSLARFGMTDGKGGVI